MMIRRQKIERVSRKMYRGETTKYVAKIKVTTWLLFGFIPIYIQETILD